MLTKLLTIHCTAEMQLSSDLPQCTPNEMPSPDCGSWATSLPSLPLSPCITCSSHTGLLALLKHIICPPLSRVPALPLSGTLSPATSVFTPSPQPATAQRGLPRPSYTIVWIASLSTPLARSVFLPDTSNHLHGMYRFIHLWSVTLR